MKKTIFIILLSLFLSLIVNAEKHGLIIAVGDYPEEGGWPDISSQNDVIHIQNALWTLGFSKENVTTILDQEATHNGIIANFQSIIDKVKKGDFVYIHFSGHGQQVLDDNGDEIDQLDESIVPYDSPLRFKPGVYEGERLIRDDLIGQMMDQIRSKCGKNGQLILILDSCHSGTGTRGMGKARGTTYVMAPDNFIKKSSTEKNMGIQSLNREDMAPMASYFGASAKELNFETLDAQSRPVGSLSYAITGVLSNMKSDYTFEELFDRIKLKMKSLAPRQNPQWEGPENIKVLGGEIELKDQKFKLTKVKDNQNIIAEVGTLTGVYEGSTVELISEDTDKPIGRGEVTKAFLTSSTITLDAPINNMESQLIAIKILEKASPSLQVTIKNDVGTNSPWTKVADRVVNSSLVVQAPLNADLYLSECGDDKAIQLATKEGTILLVEKYDASSLDKKLKNIEDEVRRFLQGKFLRSYENSDAKFDFEMELVMVDCQTEKELGVGKKDDIRLKIGSCIKFKIKNNGIKGAYFSMIDIEPTNRINPVIPAPGYTAEEYYLKAGESYLSEDIIKIYAPAGEETLKLIVSKTPQDLSGIITNQGNAKRGMKAMDPFEQALSMTYKDVGTRGVKVKPTEKDQVGTSTLFFTIVD